MPASLGHLPIRRASGPKLPRVPAVQPQYPRRSVLLREVLHPRLPPLPLPRRLRLCRALQMPATVRWQPPPSVTDDADDAFAAKAVLVAAAAAAPVVNDAVAASCLRASSRSWINYTPKHDDPGASSEV